MAVELDLTKYDVEELKRLRRQAYIMSASGLPFSAEGYRAHYHGIFTHSMPDFVWDWIQEFFDRYKSGQRRFLVKAHRGATKSTVFSIGMASYWLATNPHHSVLITQKSDTAGGDTSQSIASIIKDNVGWKQMYPHLVPDEEKGWAFAGYEIKDNSIDYGEWRQRVLDNRIKEPSFVGLGWSSGSIVGMHPNLLLGDDWHDEENTRSDREMGAVRDTVKKNILQTLNRPPDTVVSRSEEPTAIISYTPYRRTDTYAYLEATGLYHLMETPLLSPGEDFEWRGKKWSISWGKMQEPVKFVEDKVKEYGERDFALQQMLDLSAAEGMNLKREWLHSYPHEKIDPSWPTYIGIDYASSADKQKEDKHNYFALAVGKGIPGGGVILTGGYHGKISSGEAEEKIKMFHSMHNTLRIGFEKLGKGYDVMWNLIHSGLPIVQCPKDGEAKKPKGECYEGRGGLAPTFQYSRAWVSDVQDDFIKKFMDDWLSWPNGDTDTLDAVYWMLYVAQSHLVPVTTVDLGEKKQTRTGFNTRWNSLGKVRA